MTAHEDAPAGGALLTQITNEVVRTLKESFGRGPDRAKAYMMDDLLIVVMRGGMTAAEETLLASGEQDLVRTYRQRYQNHMAGRLCGLIEDMTGRTVATYQSQVLFDPFISVGMFFFEDEGARGGGGDAVEAAPAPR